MEEGFGFGKGEIWGGKKREHLGEGKAEVVGRPCGKKVTWGQRREVMGLVLKKM